MKQFMKCRFKNAKLFLICLGILAVTILPGRGLAVPLSSSTGIADITWNYLTFTYNGGEVNWLDAEGADTRSSFSSAAVGLNGVFTDPNTSDFVEGAWALTGLSTSLADATGTAGGSGLTQPTGGISRGAIQAISSINLNSAGSADVFIAQAAFTGQFTVASAGTLSITAPYLLDQNLTSTPGGFAYSDLLVGLFLENFDTAALLISDERFVANSINGPGTFTYSDTGTLTLTWDLLPGITYDFEASASTVASAAAVPEPSTLLLLGSGLIGLAATARKKLNREI